MTPPMTFADAMARLAAATTRAIGVAWVRRTMPRLVQGVAAFGLGALLALHAVSATATSAAVPAAASGATASREATPAATDPALEARVQRIAEELRCLVCQNETIAGSQAALAVDLRTQIREQLRAGRSELQVRDFMVARYGDFILYRPPWQASTVLLWLGPFALLAVAVVVLRLRVQSRMRVRAADASTAGDAAQGTTTAASSPEAAIERGWALLQADAKHAHRAGP